ncbi:response regulator transcription factor [Luteolibacter ambystomatis]|uniref:Response regulator transcription factor n=1 Tax=Luteolibacter ambystomatis TaxID=2824561 RepID=A0A975IXM8_9BACT|nr:response regulator transcription factor [Luteolibacter ambystomatis]QUE49352.1 response regulator transcription factor [Luteolibacter ambystomatis]
MSTHDKPKPASPRPSITIAVVEDDSRIRWSLSAILEEEDDFECVGSFASAEEALTHLPKLAPQVVLMDVNLPGMTGIDCVRQLTSRKNPPQIIMLTVRQDSEIIFDALAAGASGYLLKPPTASELVNAVRDVFSGGAPMTASIARRVVQSFNKARARTPETESLSPREIQVLELLVQGFAYKEVAAELGISYSTVQRHIESIYRKLHVHSRTHAVSKYLGA